MPVNRPVLRRAVVALVLCVAGFSIARGVSLLRDWITAHPHYRFSADRIVVVDPPAWSDGTITAQVRRALRPLDGESIVHPAFAEAFHTRIASVPWVRRVESIRYDDNEIRLGLDLRVPVARIERSAAGDPYYVDRDGALLPYAGRELVVPTIYPGARAPDAHQLRVAARDVVRLTREFRRRAPEDARAAMLWETWLGVQLREQPRRDGDRNTLLDLVFRRVDDGGPCRIEWGRGEVERRPGDLAFRAKLANLESILYHNPGWHDVERGVAAYLRPAIARMKRPPAMMARGDTP